jgi:malonate-semialdehyde dehydrogenase (acetylating) / methylmalonate-semialdehyde dehydrogenase
MVPMERIGHWIGGREFVGAGFRRGRVFNPAAGEQTAEVVFAEVEDVDAAIATAEAAAGPWGETSLARRTETLFKVRSVLDAHRTDIARLITGDHGKVLGDALGEVARGMENVDFACGIATQLAGRYAEQASTGVDVFSILQPLGVVAGITPFNFPAMVPMWMFASAIACGNAFVLKPSEKDPRAPVFIAELLTEAGVPDGVFNVVNGDRVAVDRILEHPTVRAISFVGSTPIARHVYESATRAGKRVQALGGAKNHMVVLADANIDMAAAAAVSGAYGSAGERCMAISVVVAVGAVAEPLIGAIAKRLPDLRIGDGLDPDSEMGPLITAEHRDKVASYLESAPAQGATVVVDGRDHPKAAGPGFFLGASLIDEVTAEMDCYRDEIFGPVLVVVRAGDYDEAIELVNANPFGNGAAIFTRDGGAARRFQHEVQTGMVGINVPVPVPVGYFSFGGWKQSLFGDTHIYGPDSVHFYTHPKVVTSRWSGPTTSEVDLGFPENG